MLKKLKDKLKVSLDKFKGKLTYSSISLLVIGLVSELLSIDIAPTEVDVIMTALATLGAIYGRYRATKGLK